MPINRVQFQKVLSLDELMIHYGAEKQCVAALEQSRWPSGFVRPSRRDIAIASLSAMDEK